LKQKVHPKTDFLLYLIKFWKSTFQGTSNKSTKFNAPPPLWTKVCIEQQGKKSSMLVLDHFYQNPT